jgi:hypothetical protein
MRDAGVLRTFFSRLTSANGLMAPLASLKPWSFLVSEGSIAGAEPLHLYGYDPATAAAGAPIWAGSSSGYPYPTADQTIKVDSTNLNDALLGTGAQTIRIWWLDAANVESTLDVNMNGVGLVVTGVVTMRRINRVEVLTCGNLGSNAGDIRVFGTDGVTVLAQIPDEAVFVLGRGHSDGAFQTVPAGKIDVICRYQGYNVNASAPTYAFLYRTSPTAPWIRYSPNRTYFAGYNEVVFDVPLRLAAGSDYGVWAYGLNIPTECHISGWRQNA